MNFIKLLFYIILIFTTTHCGILGSTDSNEVSENNANGCAGNQCSNIPIPGEDSALNDPIPSDAIFVSNKTELEQAISTVTGGETIALASGNYGDIRISSKNNSSMVVIRPQLNATPVLVSLRTDSSQNWQISGLSILPRFVNGGVPKVAVSIGGSDIIFEDSKVNFTEDSSAWSAADWIQNAQIGISLSGTRNIVRNNLIENISFGITSGATYSLVSGNRIDGFRGDGMRGLGDYTTFEYNTVLNPMKVDGNHDDGFQSWSKGANGQVGTGQVVGVILRGNYFHDLENPNHPLATVMQGIGLFDGTFVDWVVENNVVIVDHWHGISFYGSINVKIINNTVMDSNPGVRPGPPWIMITNHKNGTVSKNGLIRNNIAADYTAGPETTMDHNLTVTNPTAVFLNPALFDFRLKTGSAAIDAGIATEAPLIDINQDVRPQGQNVDLGAYEYK